MQLMQYILFLLIILSSEQSINYLRVVDATDTWSQFAFDWRWNSAIVKKLDMQCSVLQRPVVYDLWNNMSMLCN